MRRLSAGLLCLVLVLAAAKPALAEQAKTRKMQGRVLMSLGIISLIASSIAGAVMLGQERSCAAQPTCRNEDWATPIAAFTSVAVGGIFSAVGVPLYVSGTNRLAREKTRVQVQATRLTVDF